MTSEADAPPADRGESAPPSAADVPRGTSLWRDAFRRLKKNRAAVVSAVLLLAVLLACVLVPALSTYRYDRADLALGPTPPSWAHWMGTDFFGRDLMARVFFGGRISFGVALTATLVSFSIGVTWGGVAGYYGGRLDALMMRLVDVLYTFPFLIFVLLIMVFFGNPDSPLYAVFQTVMSPFLKNSKDPSYFPIFQLFLVFGS